MQYQLCLGQKFIKDLHGIFDSLNTTLQPLNHLSSFYAQTWISILDNPADKYIWTFPLVYFTRGVTLDSGRTIPSGLGGSSDSKLPPAARMISVLLSPALASAISRLARSRRCLCRSSSWGQGDNTFKHL